MTIPLASAQNLTATNVNTETTIVSDAALAVKYSTLLSQITSAASQGLFSVSGYFGVDPKLTDMLQRYGYTVSDNENLITVSWSTPSAVTSPTVSAANVPSVVVPITGLNLSTFSGTVRILLIVTFKPIGGTAPFTFTTTGNLPVGTSFSSLSNVNSITLSGTPTVASTEYASLTIGITDSLGETFSQDINWTISPSNSTVVLS
jgi:hypothetical protein